MKVGQQEDYSSHWYIDPADPEAGRYESVTSIISASNSKPWLTDWAAKLAAQYAIERHEQIGRLIEDFGPLAARDLVKAEAKRRRELKAEIGSYQHDVIEALILDRALPLVPDHLIDVEIDGEVVDLDAISDGFLNFVADHDPAFHLAEATVCDRRRGTAGTLDIVCDFPRFPVGHRRALLDAKSGIVLDKTMGAQLAAYRNSTEVWLDELGTKAPMIPVDWAGILHLRREYATGYKLFETPAGAEELAWFDAMTVQYHLGKELSSKLVRKALYPPLPDGSQPPPMLEDTNLRCRKILIAAGYVTLADVALPSPTLRAIKGIGPKSVEEIFAAYQAYQRGESVAPLAVEQEAEVA